jgi:hypothetical protein
MNMTTAIIIVILCTIVPFILWFMVHKKQKHAFDLSPHFGRNQLRFFAGSLASEALTPQERKAYQLLSKIKGDNYPKYAIRQVIQRGSRADFRQLIKELKDQQRDAPKRMVNEYGPECFNAIAAIQYS